MPNAENVVLLDSAGLPYSTSNPLPTTPVASGVDQDVNLAGINGTPPVVGHGVAAAALRVELPTDGTGTVGLIAGAAQVGLVSVSNGQTASGTTITGNPVRVGMEARTTNKPAVASTAAINAIANSVGVQIIKPYSINDLDWSYPAAAAGISNTTTAVTIKAAHATERNYITGLQLSSDALGAATEFAIRDGAAGTVLWRVKIGTAGIVNPVSVTFPSPLRGTAATLLEVVTLTASITGAVYFNAQGYTAP